MSWGPEGSDDILLSHMDFHMLEKPLVQAETKGKVVGGTCFGGPAWMQRPYTA